MARRARRHVLMAVAEAKAGHVGGALSAMDVLVALYFRILKIRPTEPLWPGRDRFVLSKGHCSIGLYAVLALRGFFAFEELATFDAIDSRLQGHPDMTKCLVLTCRLDPWVSGLSAGLGVALAAKSARKRFRTYVMLGDGECNEGIVWEAAHVAARYELDNLMAIIDCNGLQQYGWQGASASERLAPYARDELTRRWSAFGWDVVDIDGHDMREIVTTLEALGPGDSRWRLFPTASRARASPLWRPTFAGTPPCRATTNSRLLCQSLWIRRPQRTGRDNESHSGSTAARRLWCEPGRACWPRQANRGPGCGLGQLHKSGRG